MNWKTLYSGSIALGNFQRTCDENFHVIKKILDLSRFRKRETWVWRFWKNEYIRKIVIIAEI